MIIINYIKWALKRENQTLLHVKNEVADQPAHPHSLISAFVARSLESYNCTVKPVLRGQSKIDKTKVLKTNGRLMKVESIESILQYF